MSVCRGKFWRVVAAGVLLLSASSCGGLTRNGIPERVYPAFKFLFGHTL